MNLIKSLKQLDTILVALILAVTSGKQSGIIYILEWTHSNETWIYHELEMGQEAFLKRNCSFINCFITYNRSYFSDIRDFDVLLFNAVDIARCQLEVPSNRSEVQQYVLVGFEPASYSYLPPQYNFFFNITWTYKLASDVVQPYILVKNKHGLTIAPRNNMHWDHQVTDMKPIGDDIKINLSNKITAAAWIVSNCGPKNPRNRFLNKLQNELFKYNHRVDIYGKCGNQKCERIYGEKNGAITSCSNKIRSDYYFYLAFENSYGEDYVSEKILHGLNNFAVPVVFGGANYSRFMPDGIYLNARQLGPKALAKAMYEIILDKEKYYDFFKWHNYYSFHDSDEFLQRDSICGFCALLNNRKLKDQRSFYNFIQKFWNVVPSPFTVDYATSTGLYWL